MGVVLREDGGDDASLWLSDGNRYSADESFWRQEFHEHEERIIISTKQPNLYGGDILSNAKVNVTGPGGKVEQTSYLKEVYALHSAIFGVSVNVQGRNWTLHDLCVHPNEATCEMYTVLSYWEFNETAMLADKDPHATVNTTGSTAFLQPLLTKAVVGGATWVNGSLIKATALRTIFYLDATIPYNKPQEILEKWEDAVVAVLASFQKSSALLKIDHIVQVLLLDPLEYLQLHSIDDVFFSLSLFFKFIFSPLPKSYCEKQSQTSLTFTLASH